MSAKRLHSGGIINRSVPITFYWDDMPFTAYEGDTLAAALLANQQTLVARSFKYHRPRGIMSAGVEESGALVTIGSGAKATPNTTATTQEIFEGLHAYGQNAYPHVRFDVGEVSNLFGRFFAAGFYYKTFMGIPPLEWGAQWGTKIWMWYEKLIRRAAGMGEASRLPDPDSYEHQHAFCDVLVVGSGIAGLTAAITAAENGLDVLLVEQDFEWGGALLSHADISQRVELINKAESLRVRMMKRTTAFGLYENGCAGLLERVSEHLSQPPATMPRQRVWQVQAGYTIVASGSLERGFAFGNNDRPGVMTANAAQHYLNRFGVLVGQNIVIATNNDSVYATAIALQQAGAAVSIVDARADIGLELHQTASDYGIALYLGNMVGNACGRAHVNEVELAMPYANSANAASESDNEQKTNGIVPCSLYGTRLPCDSLLVSGGWSPVVHLLSQRGIKPVWDSARACFVPPAAHYPELKLSAAGAVNGLWDSDDCIQSGREAGLAAVLAAQQAAANGSNIAHAKIKSKVAGRGWQTPIAPLYEVQIVKRPKKSFVDFQHDVTSDDVRLAQREGFVSVEHLKRYTTLGMATDQGKMGNVVGLAQMAAAAGKPIDEVGTTTFRPPYTPISIGALAGRQVGSHFRPLRRTPLHSWNEARGAVMTMAGLWHRPWYYAREGESISDAYRREAKTVRECVGLCDVTSLGKIAIVGVDATELLNRLYANAFAKLPIGKARYGVMLRDDGIVMDDGTTWRLSEHEYFMTTTTANAAKVMAWMEECLQTRWNELRVHVSSVSDQWAGVAIAGPQSQKVLQQCLTNAADVDNERCPFMAVINTTINAASQKIPCRIARISFSGERAYEIYIPSDFAVAVMDVLWAAVEAAGGCLYGLEALGTMRIEKGHVTAAELDGRVTIEDAGLGKMASVKKSYIGSALKNRPELLKEDRPRLVGIFPKQRAQTFRTGALLCTPDNVKGQGIGWITAVTHSEVVGHWIGIGYVAGGHEAWAGKTLVAADLLRNSHVEVEMVSPHMFDPFGERMHD